ncbi:MAG: glycosyltransferase family 39 protein, partial [Chloroflexi bacterium]|nr:glycosyltransferase family 39 protein [Chloroflexota bacterium]
MQLSSTHSNRLTATRLPLQHAVPALAVALGLLLAIGAGAIAATRGFDGLYGQDAYAYFDYSTASVRQSLLHLARLEPFFWPPGYPLVVALASLVLGPVALAGQLVSLLMGALVPLFTVLLVRELWPDDVALALLAGALVAVCGQLWQSSVVVMADTTGLALATLSAVALVRYARSRHVAWLLLASATIAYATLARWIYGLVAVPFGVYALTILFDGRQVTRTRI